VFTKLCNRCKKYKDSSEFSKDKRSPVGLHWQCKICQSEYIKLWRDKNLDRAQAASRAWKKTDAGVESVRASNRIAKRSRKEVVAAGKWVSWRIKTGELTRPNACSTCGVSGPIDAHHDDHSKPWEIMWLCRVCHAKRHVEIGKVFSYTARKSAYA